MNRSPRRCRAHHRRHQNANGVTQEHTAIGPALNDTFINNFRIVGQGPDNNLEVHENIHITINANGEVTSTVDNESIECM